MIERWRSDQGVVIEHVAKISARNGALHRHTATRHRVGGRAGGLGRYWGLGGPYPGPAALRGQPPSPRQPRGTQPYFAPPAQTRHTGPAVSRPASPGDDVDKYAYRAGPRALPCPASQSGAWQGGAPGSYGAQWGSRRAAICTSVRGGHPASRQHADAGCVPVARRPNPGLARA